MVRKRTRSILFWVLMGFWSSFFIAEFALAQNFYQHEEPMIFQLSEIDNFEPCMACHSIHGENYIIDFQVCLKCHDETLQPKPLKLDLDLSDAIEKGGCFINQLQE